MTILLTGATGNVGRPLAGMLSGAGVSFRAFVRDADRARASLGPDVELVEGDLSDAAALGRALVGVERMFLLNGDPGLEEGAVDAAVRAGVGSVVKQSALAAGLDPPPFHRRVEERLERSGLRFTHLRPAAFMQTLSGYLPFLLAGEGVLRLPAGDGRVAWVDARDIAAVAFRALTENGHGGRIYPITGPEPLSMAAVTQEVASATGRALRYEDVAPEVARKGLVAAGLQDAMAGFLIAFYGLVREGATDFATRTVREVTGEPGRTFGAFAREKAPVLAGEPR